MAGSGFRKREGGVCIAKQQELINIQNSENKLLGKGL